MTRRPSLPRAQAEKSALLEKCSDRYQSVIELQQKLLAEEQKREEQESLLRSLREEIDAVRQTLGNNLWTCSVETMILCRGATVERGMCIRHDATRDDTGHDVYRP